MAPPDLPSTSQVNQRLIQGENTPLLTVTPSQRAAIGQGCRVSDIALVQSWMGPFRQTTVQSIMAWEPRARRRSSRLEIIGWSARAPTESELPTDGGLAGCVVSFRVRDGRREKSALWRVSDDRTDVAPANDLAREITAPLLSCVVYGLEDAQAELADCPGFEQDLMNAVARLAGALNEDIDVDFAEEPEPKKPIVLKVGQHKLTFRRLDSFDYSNARSAIGKYAKECPGLLSPLAMLALVKQQGVKEEAADLDRVLSLYPAAVESMGLLLYGTARGRAERRVGK
jgi:hypothetical protein